MAEEATPLPIPPAAGLQGADTRQVLMQKIYLKDCSLEVPLAPQVFARPWQPQVEVNVATNARPIAGDQYHLVLTITVTAKLGEDVAFLVEVHQAGIFIMRGFAGDAERAAALGAYCPGVLFPFARQAVSDLVGHAGFPQLLLQPINFEQLYVDHLGRQREKGAGAAAGNGAASPIVA